MFEVWNNNNNVWNFAHNSKNHIFTFTVHSTDKYYIFQKLLSNSKIFSDQWIIIFFHLFSQNVLFIFVKKKKISFQIDRDILYFVYLYRCHSLKNILLHFGNFLFVKISDGSATQNQIFGYPESAKKCG